MYKLPDIIIDNYYMMIVIGVAFGLSLSLSLCLTLSFLVSVSFLVPHIHLLFLFTSKLMMFTAP